MNHITQTIEQLREARRRTDDTITFLEQFQSGMDGVTLPPPADPAGPGADEERVPGRFAHPEKLSAKALADLAKLRRGPVSRGTAKQGGRRSAIAETGVSGEELHAVCAKLTEPFSAADLRQATGVNTKKADNYLRQRVGRQIFTAVGGARYKRGPKFHQAAPLRESESWRPKVQSGQRITVGKAKDHNNSGTVKPPTPIPAGVPPGTPQRSVPTTAEKPDTVVGAMKFLLRDEPDLFTREDIEDTLNADKDWQKLLATETGQKSLGQALANWVFQEYLVRMARAVSDGGDAFKVTAKGKEWFNR